MSNSDSMKVRGDRSAKTVNNILILCADHLIDAVPECVRRLDQYWPLHPEITVVGFKRPPIEEQAHVKFVSLGDMSDYPVNKWTDQLHDALEYVDAHPLIMLEDYWLTAEVDDVKVLKLWNMARVRDDALKIDLHGDRQRHGKCGNWGKYDGVPICESLPGSAYQMSFMAGIWNSALLKKVLPRGLTPWQAELDISPHVPPEMRVYGTIGIPPMRYDVAYRRGRKVV